LHDEHVPGVLGRGVADETAVVEHVRGVRKVGDFRGNDSIQPRIWTGRPFHPSPSN
jgi:hypothetical protein